MALKTKTQDVPAPASMENTLAKIGIGGNPLATVMEAERREFLPYCKIACDIEKLKYTREVNGKTELAPANNKMVVTGGGVTELVAAPLLLTVLAGRGGTRELVPNTQGGKSYDRTYSPLADAPASEKHLKQLARAAAGEKDSKGAPTIQTGNCYCVALLNPAEGKPETCVIALLEAYNVQTSYWAEACRAALVSNNNGIVISINDHECNMTTSKKDKTRAYYDPRKFTQWKQVTLTPEQKALISATVSDKAGAIDSWMKR